MSGAFLSYDGAHLSPGQMPSIESIEQDLTSVIWQPLYRCVVGANRPILGAARDVGNAPQDVLRPGLLLTKTADRKAFTTWGTVVSKAVDKIEGILLIALKMQLNGVNKNRFVGHIMLGGYVKVDGIIIPGNASAGIVGDTNEDLIRLQLRYAFKFDDDPVGHKSAYLYEPE
jgi:hypothetical protein